MVLAVYSRLLTVYAQSTVCAYTVVDCVLYAQSTTVPAAVTVVVTAALLQSNKSEGCMLIYVTLFLRFMFSAAPKRRQ